MPASSQSGFTAYDVANVYVDNTYGGYYNWFAATAGEGTQSKSSGDCAQSIAPKGWKLPSKSEYDMLVSKYPLKSSDTLMGTPKFQEGGWHYNSTSNSVGKAGYYWTCSIYGYSSSNAVFLRFSSTEETTAYNIKTNGMSVRCLARIESGQGGGQLQEKV